MVRNTTVTDNQSDDYKMWFQCGNYCYYIANKKMNVLWLKGTWPMAKSTLVTILQDTVASSLPLSKMHSWFS